MKKCIFIGIAAFALLLLPGCSGKANPALDGKFLDNKRWTEAAYDMLFDFSNSYDKFENAQTIIVGRLITSDGELVFNVGFDLSGNLFFIPLRNASIYGNYFQGWFRSADETTYSVKVDHSQIPDIMPDGTILTFTIDDIDPENLYLPEALGGRRDRNKASGTPGAAMLPESRRYGHEPDT